MLIQELKSLAEFEAIGSIMAKKSEGGWILTAFKKDSAKQKLKRDCLLELARGGPRVFKTLDAVDKLVRGQLSMGFIVR